MTTLFLFSVTLLTALLLSALAHRSILSSAVTFLVAGFFGARFGWVAFGADSQSVRNLADLALFSVLFTDGMRACLRDIMSAWRLPGRALLFGLPLTLLGTALIAHYVTGLDWTEALLLGAILSPTDPVLAEAIVGRPEIPQSLRHLLNVESGLNDGLALPFVLALLAYLGADDQGAGAVAGELVLGIALGFVVPWLAGKLESSRFFAIAEGAEPLFAFAIGLLIFSAASLTHANEYLAGFVGGVTMSTVRPDLRDAFERFGQHVTELLKLAALLVFGALVSHEVLLKLPPAGYLFALLALIAVRPLALSLALIGAHFDWRQQLAASWFGPKGFASVVYGLLVVSSGISSGDRLFHLVALVVVGSILVHSSTDVIVAHWFRNAAEKSG